MDESTVNSGEGKMIREIEQAGTWLAEQIKRHPYAEITVRVTVHDRQVRQVERGVIEKIRPEK